LSKDPNKKVENKKGIKKKQRIELQINSTINFHMIILRALFLILDDISLQEKHSLTLDVLTQLLELIGS
jgi:hypothetical protein